MSLLEAHFLSFWKQDHVSPHTLRLPPPEDTLARVCIHRCAACALSCEAHPWGVSGPLVSPREPPPALFASGPASVLRVGDLQELVPQGAALPPIGADPHCSVASAVCGAHPTEVCLQCCATPAGVRVWAKTHLMWGGRGRCQLSWRLWSPRASALSYRGWCSSPGLLCSPPDLESQGLCARSKAAGKRPQEPTVLPGQKTGRSGLTCSASVLPGARGFRLPPGLAPSPRPSLAPVGALVSSLAHRVRLRLQGC